MVVRVCVWGRGNDFMCASYVGGMTSPKTYVFAQDDGKGWSQKLELSCVTSSSTPRGNIYPFLFNTLLMLLMMTSRGIER